RPARRADAEPDGAGGRARRRRADARSLRTGRPAGRPRSAALDLPRARALHRALPRGVVALAARRAGRADELRPARRNALNGPERLRNGLFGGAALPPRV